MMSKNIFKDYEEFNDFSEGLAVVMKDELYGYIDASGKIAIPLQYFAAWSFNQGLAQVLNNGKFGFIDKMGNATVPLMYESAGEYADGLIWVMLDENYFYINKNNKRVIPTNFDNANNFSEDVASVEKNNKWGFIDTKGNTVIPYKYDDADIFSEGLAAVSISGKYANGKYGYIDKSGHEAIPMQYDYAGPFSENMAWIVIDEKFGFINKQGELVIPTQYDFVLGKFQNGKIAVLKDDDWFDIDTHGNLLKMHEKEKDLNVVVKPHDLTSSLHGDKSIKNESYLEKAQTDKNTNMSHIEDGKIRQKIEEYNQAVRNTFEEDEYDYYKISDTVSVTDEEISELELLIDIAIPLPLKDFYRHCGRLINENNGESYCLSLFEPKALIEYNTESFAETYSDRKVSFGLIDQIILYWGFDRPEFQVYGERDEGLTKEETAYINANYKCFGHWIDGDIIEGAYYLFFDREGNFGEVYYHQDAFSDIAFELKKLISDGLTNCRSLEDILVNALETTKNTMIEWNE